MRLRPILLALATLLPPGSSTPQTTISDLRRAIHLAHCVPTAPMPLARLGSRDRLPVHPPDTATLERMPAARLTPCYLVDSNPSTVPFILRP
jgi:hypothetical protein